MKILASALLFCAACGTTPSSTGAAAAEPAPLPCCEPGCCDDGRDCGDCAPDCCAAASKADAPTDAARADAAPANPR
jgi:hypothetical protein